MKKLFAILPVFLVAAFFIVGVASAHVTVDPEKVPSDSYQKFTVKVPTEKDIATTAVKVVIPKGVDVVMFEPVPDWHYQLEKDKTGKVTSVTWKADDQGLLPEQFGEFKMMGKVAPDAKQLAWKAYQTYKDGSVVKWVGPIGSEYPASVTTIVPASADSAHGGHKEADRMADMKTNDAATTQTSDNQWPLYLSILAVIFSAVALVATVLGRGKKG